MHRRALATAILTLCATTVVVVATAPPTCAAPPTVTGPDKVYPVVNTEMAFSGNDPISGDNRAVTVSGMVEGVGGCDPLPANDYSISNCPRIQMSLNTGQVGGKGKLHLPGNSPLNIDADPEPELFMAQSGAIITEVTDANGGDSVLFNFNGTEQQLNDTLADLTFRPTMGFEEKETQDGQLLHFDLLAIQGNNSSETTPWQVTLKIESQNLGPTVAVPVTQLDATLGASTQFDDEADVIDPEICNFDDCGAPYTNIGSLRETDDVMLLVAWLADPNCGTFNFLGGATFSTLGGPTHPTVENVLVDLGGLDYETDQAAAVLATLSPTALALDLSTQPSNGNPGTVFAGVAQLDEVQYALNHIVYNAPSMEQVCNLNISVSDLGNNGTPLSYVGSPLGGNNETPQPGYEVPDAKADTKSIAFNVTDRHPDVTIEQTVPGPVPGVDPTSTMALFTVTFDEPVESFTASDLDLTDGDATGISAILVPVTPNLVWSISATATGDGSIEPKLAAGAAFALGHDGESAYDSTASTSGDNSIAWDGTPPTVTIDQKVGQSDPTSVSPIVFTVVISETISTAPIELTASDIDLSASTVGGTLTATVSQPDLLDLTTFEVAVAVTGMATDGDVIASVNAGAVKDRALNDSDASTSTDNSVTWQTVDTTDPTVTINQAAGQADPTSLPSVQFTVVFSEPVVGFVTGDVTVGGTALATTGTVSGSGAIYTVDVTGMTQSGTVNAFINTGVAADASANSNAASTSVDNSVQYDAPPPGDVTPPSVTINQAVAQADPTPLPSVQFTVTFSEPVSGFATGDVTVGGTAGATTGTVSGSGASYTVDVAGMAQSGTVTASIAAGVATDASLNPNDASTSIDNSVQYDAPPPADVTPPTVTINQAAGQPDPTTLPTVQFTVVFSEPVVGFAAGDVTVGGTAGATTAAVSGSGASYSVDVSGMAQPGTVTASIVGGVAADASSNTNLASTSTDNVVQYAPPAPGDVTSPTVIVNQAAGQADPTPNSPITFSVTFSEPVAGFTTGDVTLGGTAGATTATVSGAGSSYTVAVTGMTQSGGVIASVPAGIAADASNNLNLASTSADNTVTYTLVANISLATPGGAVSITATGGQLLSFTTQPPVVPPPSGVFFPYGQLSFSASTPVGGLVTFTLVLPANPIDYYKLNGNSWQSFTWNGETGAQISGNTITITIRDNGRGDSDPTLGVATDPGVPVFATGLLPSTGADSRTPLWLGTMFAAAGGVLLVLRRLSRQRRRSAPTVA